MKPKLPGGPSCSGWSDRASRPGRAPVAAARGGPGHSLTPGVTVAVRVALDRSRLILKAESGMIQQPKANPFGTSTSRLSIVAGPITTGGPEACLALNVCIPRSADAFAWIDRVLSDRSANALVSLFLLECGAV